MTFESFEQEQNIELEMKKLRELYERKMLLQQRWSELFKEEQVINFKYPIEVQFDEQRRFRSDRGFMNPEDKEEFMVLSEEMKSIEYERDELDKEILHNRFELGIKYLSEINAQENVVWETVREGIPDPESPFGILYEKEWKVKTGDKIATVKMTGEKTASFVKGMQRVAEEIGDHELVKRIEKRPQERNLRFDNIYLSFSVASESASSQDENIKPGVNLRKQFDSFDETMDTVSAELPLGHNAYAFPEIEEDERERAKERMLTLGHQLDIESF